MNKEEIVKVVVENKQLNELKDSIAIGSASKGGLIKCYVDGLDVDQSKQRISNMVKLRIFFNEELEKV